VERSLLMSGIGGQGVQLAAQVVARAALLDGREAQLFGSYGGMMRGGNTETTLVVSDDAIDAPPTLDHAWAGVLMHHEFAAPTLAGLAGDALVFVNTSIVADVHTLARDGGTPLGADALVVEVPATDLAVDVGSILLASMVLVGALAAVTGLVSSDALATAVAASLPPYRQQHVEPNVAALAAGARAVPASVPARAAAWPAPAGATA
jgi:Pyruvate/2-oxoacid:ferredoxin oxidoreductase gamma subunit